MTKKAEQLELAAPDTAVGEISVGAFERLATDPNVDVEKLERLIAMQERAVAKQVEGAFNQAMVALQRDMPEVLKKGKVDFTSSKGKGRTNYNHARMEDIQRVLREPLAEHGFALMFKPEQREGSGLTVTARLLHSGGHSETATLTAPHDSSGNKNSIQAMASTEKYLMRYTAVALLNLTTAEEDDDGVSSEAPEAPKDYEDWLLELEAVASEQGMAALQKFWKAAPTDRRAYLTKWNAGGWVKVKATAAKAGK